MNDLLHLRCVQLKESTVTNATTGATETVTIPGDIVAVLNVTDNATSVSGQVTDAGGGRIVHTLEIKFDQVNKEMIFPVLVQYVVQLGPVTHASICKNMHCTVEPRTHRSLGA